MSDSSFPFASLSPELQSYILRSIKETKSLSRSLTVSIRQASDVQFVKDEYNLTVSQKEVEKYIDNYAPIIRAKFFFNDGEKNHWWCYVAEIKIRGSRIPEYIGEYYQTDQHRGTSWLGNMGWSKGESVLDLINKDEEKEKYVEYNIIRYDLMTMYYCYRNRKTCVDIDPDYAKKKVLKHFEEMMTGFSYETMLVFLRANARIMGIQMDYGLHDGFYEDSHHPEKPNCRRIKRECRMLEKEIRNRLLALQADNNSEDISDSE